MKNFYVYGYFRSDGTPYYIGKGCGRRAWNPHKRNMLPKDASRIKILLDGMNEREALQAEVDFIALLGRKDAGTGCLRNLTDGGEGTCGRSYIPSKKHRANLSAAAAGCPKSSAHKENISKALKGKPKSLSHRQKLSEARGTKRDWYHETHGTRSCSAAQLARDHGLSTGALSKVVYGHSKQHKGWRLM